MLTFYDPFAPPGCSSTIGLSLPHRILPLRLIHCESISSSRYLIGFRAIVEFFFVDFFLFLSCLFQIIFVG